MQSQNEYLHDFLPKRDQYVSEILTREACFNENRNCFGCKTREGSWRCLDCLGQGSYCTQCFRDAHLLHPFHRVEHWTGSHFDPAWLCQAGVRIHLGHGGRPCPVQTEPGEDREDNEELDGQDSGGVEDEDKDKDDNEDEDEWEDEAYSDHSAAGTSPLPDLKG